MPRSLRVLVPLCVVLALAACRLDRPVTGRVCAVDDDCVRGANGAEYHCELAAAPQVCLPGPAGVARRPNRAPYALDTLVVVPVGFGETAQLQLVDPDGDDHRITSTGGQFSAGGVTASVTVLDAASGLLGIDTTGAIEGVVPLTLSDEFENTAVVQVFVVAVDADALVQWTGAVSSAFSDGANWDGGATPTAGQSFLVVDNGPGHLRSRDGRRRRRCGCPARSVRVVRRVPDRPRGASLEHRQSLAQQR
jgi:hypothetical protein